MPIDPKKEAPDFLVREIETSGAHTIDDINYKDPLAQQYILKDKEYYKTNPGLQDYLKEKNVNFDDFYHAVADKYDDLRTTDSDVRRLSTPLVMSGPYAGLFGGASPGANKARAATIQEMGVDKHLTAKEIAQERGVKDPKTGLWDTSKDDSAWDNLTGKSNLKVAKNDDGTYKTDDDGAFYLEEFDPRKRLKSTDELVSIWNSGVYKNTWFDGNKVDESLAATAFRKLPQAVSLLAPLTGPFAPVVKALGSLGYFMDVASGTAEVAKTVMNAYGIQDTDWINAFQNQLDKFSADQTYDQMEHPYGMKNILANTMDVVGQINGMGMISKYGGKGVGKLISALNKSGAVNAIAPRVGNVLGMLSMSLNSSEDMARIGREKGISPEDMAWIHAATIGAYMYTGKMSERFLNPITSRIEKQALNSAFKQKLDTTIISKLKAGSPEASKFVSSVVKMARKASEKLAKSDPIQGFLTEGFEEVSENAWEEGIKSFYNWRNQDKEAGKGRYDDFNSDQFIRESTLSFLYGGLAGGLLSTKVGKKLMQSPDSDMRKDLFDYALDPEGREQYERQLNRIKSTYDPVRSFAKGDNGEYLDVDAGSNNPVQQYSQQDLVDLTLRAGWDQAKKLVDYKAASLVNDPDWRTTLKDSFKNKVSLNETSINEDIASLIEKSSSIDDQIQGIHNELKEGLRTEEEAKVAIAALNEDRKPVDQGLKEILSGQRSADYVRKAIYNDLGSPISYEELSSLNQEVGKNSETSKTSMNQQFQETRERSEKVLDSVIPVREINRIIHSGSISAKAAAGLKEKSTDPAFIKEQLEAAKNDIRATLPEKVIANPLIISKEEVIQYVLQKVDQAQSLMDIRQISAQDETTDDEGELVDSVPLVSMYPNIREDYALDTDRIQTGFDQYHELIDLLRLPEINENVDSAIHSMYGDYHSPEEVNRLMATGKLQAKELPFSAESASIIPLIRKRADHLNALRRSTPFEYLNEIEGPQTPAIDAPELKKALNDFRKQPVQSLQQKHLLLALLTDHFNNRYLPFEQALRTSHELMTSQFNQWQESKSGDPVLELKQAHANELDEVNQLVQDLILNDLLMFDGDPHVVDQAKKASTLYNESLDNKSYDQKVDLAAQADKALHDLFTGADEPTQNKLVNLLYPAIKAHQNKYKDHSGLLSRKLLRTIQTIDRTGGVTPYQELLDLIESSDSAPTYEQMTAIRQAYGALKSNITERNGFSEKLWKRLMEDVEKTTIRIGGKVVPADYVSQNYDNVFFISGKAGSGKTTYVGVNVLKLTTAALQRSGAPSKIIATAHKLTQQRNLQDQLTDLEVANDKNIHLGINELIRKMEQNDKEVQESGVIVFDEATFIYGDDLARLSEVLKKVNASRKVPLQVVLMGDPMQVGALSRKEGSSDEVNVGKVVSMQKTEYITRSQRNGIKSINDLLNRINSHSSNPTTVFTRLDLETTFGYYGSDPAGVEIIDGGLRKEESIRELLNSGESVMYIHDRDLNTDPEYQRLINVPGLEKIAKAAHTVEEAQGGEADFVVIDLSKFNYVRGKQEALFYKRLNVAVSRAKKKVLIINNSEGEGRRNWSSIQSVQTRLEGNLKSEYFDAMRRFTETQLNSIVNSLQADTERAGDGDNVLEDRAVAQQLLRRLSFPGNSSDQVVEIIASLEPYAHLLSPAERNMVEQYQISSEESTEQVRLQPIEDSTENFIANSEDEAAKLRREAKTKKERDAISEEKTQNQLEALAYKIISGSTPLTPLELKLKNNYPDQLTEQLRTVRNKLEATQKLESEETLLPELATLLKDTQAYESAKRHFDGILSQSTFQKNVQQILNRLRGMPGDKQLAEVKRDLNAVGMEMLTDPTNFEKLTELAQAGRLAPEGFRPSQFGMKNGLSDYVATQLDKIKDLPLISRPQQIDLMIGKILKGLQDFTLYKAPIVEYIDQSVEQRGILEESSDIPTASEVVAEVTPPDPTTPTGTLLSTVAKPLKEVLLQNKTGNFKFHVSNTAEGSFLLMSGPLLKNQKIMKITDLGIPDTMDITQEFKELLKRKGASLKQPVLLPGKFASFPQMVKLIKEGGLQLSENIFISRSAHQTGSLANVPENGAFVLVGSDQNRIALAEKSILGKTHFDLSGFPDISVLPLSTMNIGWNEMIQGLEKAAASNDYKESTIYLGPDTGSNNQRKLSNVKAHILSRLESYLPLDQASIPVLDTIKLSLESPNWGEAYKRFVEANNQLKSQFPEVYKNWVNYYEKRSPNKVMTTVPEENISGRGGSSKKYDTYDVFTADLKYMHTLNSLIYANLSGIEDPMLELDSQFRTAVKAKAIQLNMESQLHKVEENKVTDPIVKQSELDQEIDQQASKPEILRKILLNADFTPEMADYTVDLLLKDLDVDSYLDYVEKQYYANKDRFSTQQWYAIQGSVILPGVKEFRKNHC